MNIITDSQLQQANRDNREIATREGRPFHTLKTRVLGTGERTVGGYRWTITYHGGEILTRAGLWSGSAVARRDAIHHLEESGMEYEDVRSVEVRREIFEVRPDHDDDYHVETDHDGCPVVVDADGFKMERHATMAEAEAQAARLRAGEVTPSYL